MHYAIYAIGPSPGHDNNDSKTYVLLEILPKEHLTQGRAVNLDGDLIDNVEVQVIRYSCRKIVNRLEIVGFLH